MLHVYVAPPKARSAEYVCHVNKSTVSMETSSPTVASEAVLAASLATKDCVRPTETRHAWRWCPLPSAAGWLLLPALCRTLRPVAARGAGLTPGLRERLARRWYQGGAGTRATGRDSPRIKDSSIGAPTPRFPV